MGGVVNEDGRSHGGTEKTGVRSQESEVISTDFADYADSTDKHKKQVSPSTGLGGGRTRLGCNFRSLAIHRGNHGERAVVGRIHTRTPRVTAPLLSRLGFGGGSDSFPLFVNPGVKPE